MTRSSTPPKPSPPKDAKIKRFVVKPEGLSHRPFHDDLRLVALRKELDKTKE